jgi:hypothetical protein
MSWPKVYQERKSALNEENISKWAKVIKGCGNETHKQEVKQA